VRHELTLALEIKITISDWFQVTFYVNFHLIVLCLTVEWYVLYLTGESGVEKDHCPLPHLPDFMCRHVRNCVVHVCAGMYTFWVSKIIVTHLFR
jgi:hypothetical protein